MLHHSTAGPVSDFSSGSDGVIHSINSIHIYGALLDAQDCPRSLYDNEQNPVPGLVELSFKGVEWEKTDGKTCKQIRLWYNVRKSKVRQRVRAGFSALALVTFWMR